MEKLNIIFIVVDTLRKDYAKPLEEELKKLGFISYENVITPASWTTPSHASMFTGLYPAFHEAHETKTKKDIEVILKKNNLLSANLSRLGYYSYLLSANPYICPEFGFRGFTQYYDVLYMPNISLLSERERKIIEQLKDNLKDESHIKLLLTLINNGEYKLFIKAGFNFFINLIYPYICSIIKKWPKEKGSKYLIKNFKKILLLNDNPSVQKFIFINLMEVHEPYFIGDTLGGKGFRENLKNGHINHRELQKWKQIYPKEVEYVTKRILELIKILKEKNQFDNSLIIITSDHGQLLGEHGRISHGTFLYDELLRVPLLIKYPKDYKIEITKNNSKYISLVKLKPFILNLIENNLTDDSILYSDVVFAESYGIHQRIKNISNEEERKNIENLEKYRIAIYYKNFKGIFNVEDWKFEEIISYNSNLKITEDVVKYMKKEIIKFLNTATAMKIPKINFK